MFDEETIHIYSRFFLSKPSSLHFSHFIADTPYFQDHKTRERCFSSFCDCIHVVAAVDVVLVDVDPDGL